MGILFDPSEVFQLAIRIEENGEKFYRTMSQKLKDPEIKEVFKFLAEEEIAHKNFYKETLSEFEHYEPYESYPDEYFSYLRSYADRIIFSQKTFEKKLNEISDVISAIDFAIGAELDSILYFQEMKKMVPENNQKKIEIIIKQERKHFVKLAKLKKSKEG